MITEGDGFTSDPWGLGFNEGMRQAEQLATPISPTTGDVEPVSADEARVLTDRIKAVVGEAWSLVTEAYQRQAWTALGYASWDDYCAKEFSTARLRLPREERQEVIASLKESGLSDRAIASATGVDRKTVRKDLQQVGEIPPPEKAVVLGTDGKTYARTSRPPSKPDLGGGVSHPARFTDTHIEVFAKVLPPGSRVLDVFGGTGRVHDLQDYGFKTVGVEIEEEWAAQRVDTIHGNALALPFTDSEFDAICTSPTYGNRLADDYNANDPDRRRSYRFDLGRPLHPDNSGSLDWGSKYRDFHERAWREALRVLRPGGLLIVNIQDHIRGGEQQLVSTWHVACLVGLGLAYDPVLSRWIDTRSLGVGANRDARVDGELVLVFRKPS